MQKYGEEALRSFVASFAEGIDTETAIARVYKTDFDALQVSFDTYINERFGAIRRVLAAPEGFWQASLPSASKAAAAGHPDSYAVQMALGRALGPTDPAGALEAFERAAKLAPMITGPETVYMEIVEIALARGDKARAAATLETMAALRAHRGGLGASTRAVA